MKIALINPGNHGTMQPPLALGYLASYALSIEPALTIKIMDENCGEYVTEDIKSFKPDIIGITSTTPLMADASRLAKAIKIFSKAPIIIGGYHASALPKLTLLQERSFNLAVIGEGEETFGELIKLYKEKGEFGRDDLKKIAGVAYRNREEVEISPPRLPLSGDAMNSYPPPARELLNMEYYLQPREVVYGMIKRATQMMTSRGCPYDCRFCGSKTINNRRWRAYDPARVMEEIKHLVDHYGVEIIYFQDDMFSVDRKRAEEICNLLISTGLNKKISWMYQERANFIDERLMRLYHKAGCIQVSFGLESGSQPVLDYLKKDKSTVEQNQKAIDISYDIGLRVTPSFMIGGHNETKEQINETLNFISKNLDKMKQVQLYVATPYPGSPMWDDWVKENRVDISSLDWSQFWMGLSERKVYVANKVSPDELEKIYNRFILKLQIHYNLNPSYIFKKFLTNPKRFLSLLWGIIIRSITGKKS